VNTARARQLWTFVFAEVNMLGLAQTRFGYLGYLGETLALEFSDHDKNNHMVVYVRGTGEAIRSLNAAARFRDLPSDGTVTMDIYWYRFGLFEPIPPEQIPSSLSHLPCQWSQA
jgi:hypothetical protein